MINWVKNIFTSLKKDPSLKDLSLKESKHPSQDEWELLLCGVIVSGICKKLKTGEALSGRQQYWVDLFPDLPWPKCENLVVFK